MRKTFTLPLLVIFVLGCATAQKRAPQYYGPKKRIAVMDFENKVPDSHRNIGTGLTEMLITALYETGRFIILERKAVQDVIREQDLGYSGRVEQETAARVGQLLGAQLLVRGAVTEFEENAGGGALGGIIPGEMFGGGLGVTKAHVAVDVRMYDANTGVIVAAKRAQAKARSVGILLAGVGRTGNILGGGLSTRTPLGKATRECIEKIVQAIVNKMENIPWQGRVVTIKQGKVYINAGADSGIKAGEILIVYRPGEELTDPETGMSLGSEERMIGKIKVIRPEKKFSVCDFIEGVGFQRGDVVKMGR